jgi:hypothetical protein
LSVNFIVEANLPTLVFVEDHLRDGDAEAGVDQPRLAAALDLGVEEDLKRLLQ